VLLVRVSILGGSAMVGVGLSLLVILNLRNGMGLADITGNTRSHEYLARLSQQMEGRET
jgi:rhamnose transport system permease protein